MKKQDILLCLLFFLIGVLSRLPLVEKMQSHMDGPTYSIALVNYSFEQDNPTAPGYPLYVGIGKVFLLFTHDPHLALLLTSVFFSGIGAVVFYMFGKNLMNRFAGITAASLFLSAPTIYFFGVTVYGYLLVLVVSTMLAWCVYAIAFMKKKYGLLLGILYAILLGIRPQEVIWTLPLFLFGMWYLTAKEKGIAVIVFLSGFFLWFVPFVILTGGLEHFLNASAIASQSGLPAPSLFHIYIRRFELGSGIFLTLGFSILVLLFSIIAFVSEYRKKRKFTKTQKKFLLFASYWFIPPLLFNLFVRTDHAGYQFGFLSFFIFIVAVSLAKLQKKYFRLTLLITLFLICSNLVLFFYDRDPNRTSPYRQTSFHYSDLQRNDFELSTKVNYIRKNYQAGNTILFSSTPFWKQYMYHLPEYSVYSVDRLFSKDRRYNSLIRVGNNWRREMIKNSGRIHVPPGKSLLVILDSDSCVWASQEAIRVEFQKKTCMSVLSLRENTYIFLSYHQISLIPVL